MGTIVKRLRECDRCKREIYSGKDPKAGGFELKQVDLRDGRNELNSYDICSDCAPSFYQFMLDGLTIYFERYAND
ncbi:hypothetical protein MMAGJ_50310 [Mycolicibacterium mageritense]|uniref:Uncharacterized protein n=1 Tax=Mycolicibacterium mageritense TaxID=53462 RepID=A0ABM7HYR4_MYCME|nr:hypothetical protein MMAGJ_50310 [Mycolicibacterium mageritense]